MIPVEFVKTVCGGCGRYPCGCLHIPSSPVARTEPCDCGALITAIPATASGIFAAVEGHRATTHHRRWAMLQRFDVPLPPRRDTRPSSEPVDVSGLVRGASLGGERVG